MNQPIDQMFRFYDAQLQVAAKISGLWLAAARQISEIAAQEAQDSLNEQGIYAEALASAKDLQGVVAVTELFARPGTELAWAFAREMMGTVSDTCLKMTGVYRGYLERVGEHA